jgi:hypothetical protein
MLSLRINLLIMTITILIDIMEQYYLGSTTKILEYHFICQFNQTFCGTPHQNIRLIEENVEKQAVLFASSYNYSHACFFSRGKSISMEVGEKCN